MRPSDPRTLPSGTTDLLLIRFAWTTALDGLRSTSNSGAPAMIVCRSLDGREGYAWLSGDSDPRVHFDAASGGAFAAAAPVRLERLRELPGASAAGDAPYRYIVETDVEPGHDADFNAWYDDEHLAGLASVPGTVRAARYVAIDDRPRYHAYYDLERPGVLDSQAWLAVRATPWSDRVRPRFVNTRRTMFRICR